MWIKHKLARIFLCLVLGLGALAGVPMSPEKIAELLSLLNQPKIELSVKKDEDEGDLE
jgi:hypothetical protein